MTLPKIPGQSSASPEQSGADKPLGAEDEDLADVAALHRELATVKERAADAMRAERAIDDVKSPGPTPPEPAPASPTLDPAR